MNKFKQGEAIVFNPDWWEKYPEYHDKHPLKKGELVYFISHIPNVEGHCIVCKYNGILFPMVHPGDFRKAKEEEL